MLNYPEDYSEAIDSIKPDLIRELLKQDKAKLSEEVNLARETHIDAKSLCDEETKQRIDRTVERISAM